MHVDAFSYISRGKSATFRSSSSLLSVVPTTQFAGQEKEKPAKFANGSLLENDSGIFVQHHGAYPLSGIRLSPSASSHSVFLLVAFLPPISLFQSSTVPRRVLHPFTFYFALSRVFGAFLCCHNTLYFPVCILDFVSFT